jgi:hypothetical protein
VGDAEVTTSKRTHNVVAQCYPKVGQKQTVLVGSGITHTTANGGSWISIHIDALPAPHMNWNGWLSLYENKGDNKEQKLAEENTFDAPDGFSTPKSPEVNFRWSIIYYRKRKTYHAAKYKYVAETTAPEMVELDEQKYHDLENAVIRAKDLAASDACAFDMKVFQGP